MSIEFKRLKHANYNSDKLTKNITKSCLFFITGSCQNFSRVSYPCLPPRMTAQEDTLKGIPKMDLMNFEDPEFEESKYVLTSPRSLEASSRLGVKVTRGTTYEGFRGPLMSRIMRKPTFWFPTWPNTDQAVQLQKMARGLKFRI